jgi:hypothetical protein
MTMVLSQGIDGPIYSASQVSSDFNAQVHARIPALRANVTASVITWRATGTVSPARNASGRNMTPLLGYDYDSDSGILLGSDTHQFLDDALIQECGLWYYQGFAQTSFMAFSATNVPPLLTLAQAAKVSDVPPALRKDSPGSAIESSLLAGVLASAVVLVIRKRRAP